MVSPEVLGFIGGGLSAIQGAPQARRVRSLGHGVGVSLATWVLTFFVNVTWLGYGVLNSSPSIVISNLAGALVSGSVIAALVPATPAILKMVPSAIGVVAAVQVLPVALVSAVLVGLTASRTPQLLHSIRSRKVGHESAVSLQSLAIGTVALLCWGAFAIMTQRPLMMLTTTIALTLTLSIALFETLGARALRAGAQAPSMH